MIDNKENESVEFEIDSKTSKQTVRQSMLDG